MILDRIIKNNLVGTIEQDPDPANPRTQCEQLSRLILWHNRYKIGDDHSFTPEEFDEMMRESDGLYVPVYMYEHSGITISTSPFPCKWDSGQVGWAYMTRKIVDDWFNGDDSRALKSIEAEIREYDDYIRGDIYMITIKNEDGEMIECCGGYNGYDYAKESLEELLSKAS